MERIQSRPLPAPPAPKRAQKQGGAKKPAQSQEETVGASLRPTSTSPGPQLSSASPSFRSARSGNVGVGSRSPRPTSSSSGEFLSVQSTLSSRTLVDSEQNRRRSARPLSDDEETTLADSIVDSMHSCADTLVGSEDEEATLHEGTDDEEDGGEAERQAREALGDLEAADLSPEEQMQRFVARMGPGGATAGAQGAAEKRRSRGEITEMPTFLKVLRSPNFFLSQ